MKSTNEREQLIKDINVLLHQAYDSTLDEIYALLKKIDDLDDEEDWKLNAKVAHDNAPIDCKNSAGVNIFIPNSSMPLKSRANRNPINSKNWL
ncbi:MAG: hypothetical protein ACYTXY_15865 [Nostoc sp.]